jgi:hypothetical protein
VDARRVTHEVAVIEHPALHPAEATEDLPREEMSADLHPVETIADLHPVETIADLHPVEMIVDHHPEETTADLHPEEEITAILAMIATARRRNDGRNLGVEEIADEMIAVVTTEDEEKNLADEKNLVETSGEAEEVEEGAGETGVKDSLI